ncbi:hypothetical protein Phi48:2_gp29 [Cellulophaga phage phi48:2]|uniref:hypothetical protein n=1 Tax=Cellulophaga phage phi48:2 TaxID=1327968 RepID=UPI000351D95F|nr:hypothetical protein Phi48:2_gp29 [Cellulophaga phage phi48:2]AGO47277.1 hypothetical protein Phi48:2_gp29 [Cellulophaga phage phi48:2]
MCLGNICLIFLIVIMQKLEIEEIQKDILKIKEYLKYIDNNIEINNFNFAPDFKTRRQCYTYYQISSSRVVLDKIRVKLDLLEKKITIKPNTLFNNTF